LKLHEDWGTTPAAIDNCLAVADEMDVQAAIHTDTLNESGFVEDTIAAFKGRAIHTYHTEGAGGGHAPDIIKACGEANVLPSSTNPTRPYTVNTIDEHLDMLMVCHHLDPAMTVNAKVADGSRVEPGTVVAELSGKARAMLSAERIALNFLGRMSGIATLTRTFVDAVAGTRAQIVDTRKTTPGLRAFEKYAVRAGGGMNHRVGLFDAVLIKDNHVALAGGIGLAVTAARQRVGHMVKIEVEVDTLDQLDELLEHGADAVLLDNMPPETMAEAVRRINGRMISEASGGIRLETVRAIAESGVDLISIGALTHSARVLDLGLDCSVAKSS